MPMCPFCGGIHRSKRGEHIIPKWMSRQFPDAKWEIEDQLTKYVRKSTKYINLRTPIPCSTCNNGWMSDLEKATKPILVPLINGETSSLTAEDQVTIARWLVKTAMVYDLDAAKRAPRPRYFQDDELRSFKIGLNPYPTYMYFVAAYNGRRAGIFQEDHSGFTVSERGSSKPLTGPVRVYALTLVMKHLVLQICCAKVPESIGHFYMKDFRAVSSQIGVATSNVAWPPSLALGDDLIGEFIRRWSDVPPPRSASD